MRKKKEKKKPVKIPVRSRDTLTDIESVTEPDIQNETIPEEPQEPTPEDLIIEAESRADEYLDALQRLKADFDNYRKRVEKDRGRMAELHQSTVLDAIMPTLDAFDAAFSQETVTASDDFRTGIELVRDGLLDALKKMGLQRIDTVGKPFDPELAEAMMTTPTSEVPEDHVVQEVSAGYLFKGNVLRAAKVIVAAAPE